MKTNEAFSLSDDGRICVGDVHTDSGPRGRYIETISSIPAFIKTIQNDPNCYVEHLHRSLFSQQSRKVAVVGRKAVWVRWIDNGETYELKSDYTIREANGHIIAGRLSLSTDMSEFIASLRREGHEVLFVHPRFQISKDMRTKVNA